MTGADRYPPTPPSSTSLPEHWQFVPPPTDGPNTRARRAHGLQPFSGTAAPLPVSTACQGLSGPAGTDAPSVLDGSSELDLWSVAGSSQQYWYTAGPTNDTTYYTSDPAPNFAGPNPSQLADSLPVPFSAYPIPPHSTSYAGHNGDRRVLSTASVIDYGSPPRSPNASPSLPELPPPPVVGLPLPSVGVSKEEWLRLGGFVDEETEGSPPDPSPTRSAPHFISIQDEDYPQLPVPPSYEIPSLPTSAPCASTYSLPPVFALDDGHTDALALPTLPPSQLEAGSEPSQLEGEQTEASLDIMRSPMRSSRRRAPSPLDPTRLRPNPYPTTSSASPSASPRVLTPISTALALYACHPAPSSVPPPLLRSEDSGPSGEGGKKRTKKTHARKFSIDHVPRPRNAFILFRSHAVSAELIPRSMGIADHKNISQIIGSVWRGLSPVERKKWEDLAEEEKRLHKERYPDYVYKPKQKGQRAPVGQGKKAKAQAAKLAAERAREEAIAAISASGEAVAGPVGAECKTEDEYSEVADDCPAPSTSQTPPRPRRSSVAQFPSPTSPSPRKRKARRASLRADVDELREQRRMELIGQAMLEGEDDDAILPRVQAELEAEDKALQASAGSRRGKGDEDILVDAPPDPPSRSTRNRSSPVKQSRTSQASTPRKTRSSVHRHLQRVPSSPSSPLDISVGGKPHGPAATAVHDSDSTLSPSPYCRVRAPSSPASSASPSPQRMQQIGHAPGRSTMSRVPSGSRHPLSRSVTRREQNPPQDSAQEGEDDHDLPAARRRNKAHSYATVGLGIAMAPAPAMSTSSSPTAGTEPVYAFPPLPVVPPRWSPLANSGNVPLFAGPANSRQFSLGRWELRKPSTTAGSHREALAAQNEYLLGTDITTSSGGTNGGSHSGFALAGPNACTSTSGWLDRAASPSDAVPASSTWARPVGEVVSPSDGDTLAMDPRAFLAASGLEDDPVLGSGFDAVSDYGTAASSSGGALWDDGASSMTYETAPSSASGPPSRSGRWEFGSLGGDGRAGRVPLFRAPSSTYSTGAPVPIATTLATTAGHGACDGADALSGVFHFGEVDLFAAPPSAFGSVERGGVNVFGPPQL